MFICRDTRKRFYEYLEGRLSLAEKAKMESHLNKCTFCLREFVKTKRLFELLSKNETPKPTEDFWRQFDIELKAKIASVREKEAERFALRPLRSFAPRLSLRPAFALASVLIFVIGILLVGRFNQKSMEFSKLKIVPSKPISISPSKESTSAQESIMLAESEEKLSADDLLEELYLLDELSQEDAVSEAEDFSDNDIESNDLPYLYELDPQLAEEFQVG